MKNIRNLLLMLLLIPVMVMAGAAKGKYTKEKKISKSYTVNANAGLTVSNKFGNVYVTTWDQNETAIDVVITISGNDESDVIKRLNGTDVLFEASKQMVSASTKIANYNGSMSIEVNYTIRVPKNGSMGINNQYGAIRLGKIYGATNLDCQYGDLAIEELNSNSNVIKIEYCDKSKIGSVKSADIVTQYSGLQITKVNTLKLNAQYTDVDIATVNAISYKCQYSDMKIKSVDNITGTGTYSDLTIGSIGELLNVTASYGHLNVGRVEKTVKNIAVVANYVDVNVGYSQDLAFDFEFITEYSDVSGISGFKFTQKVEKSTSGVYKGYNKAIGNSRMYIKAMYSDIKFW